MSGEDVGDDGDQMGWQPEAVRSRSNAYDLIADQIRLAILQGKLRAGDRLPGEAELAKSFDVSRGTIREALRVLASQELIRTTRGVKGGSTISHPSPGQVQRYLGTSLELLAGADAATVEWMLEARELLEIPAAGLAARRAHTSDISAMMAALDAPQDTLFTAAHSNQGFHLAVVRATGNTMLEMMLQPFFAVMNTRLKKGPPRKVLHQVHDEHVGIASAIRSGDAEAASTLMRDHLQTLRGVYELVLTTPTGDRGRPKPHTSDV